MAVMNAILKLQHLTQAVAWVDATCRYRTIIADVISKNNGHDNLDSLKLNESIWHLELRAVDAVVEDIVNLTCSPSQSRRSSENSNGTVDDGTESIGSTAQDIFNASHDAVRQIYLVCYLANCVICLLYALTMLLT